MFGRSDPQRQRLLSDQTPAVGSDRSGFFGYALDSGCGQLPQRTVPSGLNIGGRRSAGRIGTAALRRAAQRLVTNRALAAGLRSSISGVRARIRDVIARIRAPEPDVDPALIRELRELLAEKDFLARELNAVLREIKRLLDLLG